MRFGLTLGANRLTRTPLHVLYITLQAYRSPLEKDSRLTLLHDDVPGLLKVTLRIHPTVGTTNRNIFVLRHTEEVDLLQAVDVLLHLFAQDGHVDGVVADADVHRLVHGNRVHLLLRDDHLFWETRGKGACPCNNDNHENARSPDLHSELEAHSAFPGSK